MGLFAKAQTKEVKLWVGDTASVYLSPDYESWLEPGYPDSTIGLKIRRTTGIKYCVYSDTLFSKKLMEITDLSNEVYESKRWHTNGQLVEETGYFYSTEYKDTNYLCKNWFPDGKLRIEMEYKDNLVYFKHYYHSGKLAKLNISRRTGNTYEPLRFEYCYTERWCENGQLLEKDSVNKKYRYSLPNNLNIKKEDLYNISIIHDFKVWHCNGRLHREFIWDTLSLTGKYYEWYENGKLKVEGKTDYTIYFFFFQHGLNRLSKYNGTWKFYNEDGIHGVERMIKGEELVYEKDF